jgi:deoxyxylulose-5-phosphate synthase
VHVTGGAEVDRGDVRRDIICSDAGLRERDLRKRAALADAIRQGFLDRGVGARTGTLAAELSVSVLHIALDQSLDQDGDRPLFDIVLEALQDLLTTLTSTWTTSAW